MKKMNAMAVLVVLMSATNVFADATCAELWTEIRTSESNIAQSQELIKQLDIYIPEVQAEVINKQINSKGDSLILGGGQEGLQAKSFQAVKSRANLEVSIRHNVVKIQTLSSEYMEKCSSFEKFD